MSEVSSLELTAGVAVASVAISAFAAFMPSMDKVVEDDSFSSKLAVEFGQNAAAIATLSVGTVMSVVTKSPMPMVTSIFIAAALIFVYEFALRKGANV